MNAKIGLTTRALPTRVVMEGAPEDGPIAMAFHSNRHSQNFFGGGQDVFHVLFYDLLLNGVNVYELSAQDMGDGSHDCRQPVMWLAGSDGDQDE